MEEDAKVLFADKAVISSRKCSMCVWAYAGQMESGIIKKNIKFKSKAVTAATKVRGVLVAH